MAQIGWAGSTYAGNWQVFGKMGTTPGGHYVGGGTGNGGTEWEGSSQIPRSFGDGTSNTIIFAEKYARCSTNGTQSCDGNGGGSAWARWDGLDQCASHFAGWTTGTASFFQVQPMPFNSASGVCNTNVASSPHIGGMNVCLGDGSVRSVNQSMNATTWWNACTPAGGETQGADW